MNLYKYLLFDFDGTLIDTNELILLTLNETSLKFCGRYLSQEKMNSILGRHLEDQMKCLSPHEHEKLTQFYREFYKQNQDLMVREFPGVAEMLDALRRMGCKTAIVSAKGRGGIEHGLDRFNLSGYIDVVVSAYDVTNNKPHPEPALKALEALGAEPGSAFLVGDSPYDILCGKNAGVKTVLAGWSIFPQEALLRLKPDFYIRTPSELVDIVRQSVKA